MHWDRLTVLTNLSQRYTPPCSSEVTFQSQILPSVLVRLFHIFVEGELAEDECQTQPCRQHIVLLTPHPQASGPCAAAL